MNEDDNCTICIEPLEEYDYLKIFAVKDGKDYGCGHVFHKKCIRKWLEKASACPLCMHQLPVDDNQVELDRIEARYFLENSRKPRNFFLDIENCSWLTKNVEKGRIIFPRRCLDDSVVFLKNIVLFLISSAVLLKILEYDSLDDSYHDEKFHNQIYKKNNKNNPLVKISKTHYSREKSQC